MISPECLDGAGSSSPGEWGAQVKQKRDSILPSGCCMGDGLEGGGVEARRPGSGAKEKGWRWALWGRRRGRWEGQRIRSLKGQDYVGSCRVTHTQTEWSRAERRVPSCPLQTPRLTQTPMWETHCSTEMDSRENQHTGTDLQGAGDTVTPGKDQNGSAQGGRQTDEM